MKKILLLIFWCTLLLVQNGYSQTIRPFSYRYHNPSVRGNVVYVSNSIISTSGVGAGSPGTGEVPPGGGTRNNAGNGIYLNAAGTTTSTLIPFGSPWKYYVSFGAAPAGAWTSLGYNDILWPTGNSELGYGDGDEATCIPSGQFPICAPVGNKWITTYFRKTINIPSPGAYTSFTFNMKYDDGYVVYVNGVEVARKDLPVGPIVYGTLATVNNENALFNFTLPYTAFAAGNNDIAVEIHQKTANDPDISFNMQLTAIDVFNSSTADLNLSSCSNVLWAGLYWGAGQGITGNNTGWITGETTCKLKIPGAGSYTTITSTVTDYHNNSLPGCAALVHTGYKCYADITSLINTASPNGTYTVGSVLGPLGIGNAYGGWTIVVAFSNPSDIIRELNIYDGNVIVDLSQPPVNINLSGFTTPPVGPVTCELGAVVYDGDRTGLDSFSFKQNGAPAFLNLTPNATSNLNDMWNSTISYKGANVTTRNPAFQNTLGYDADIIDLPNPGNANLGNNQTAATIRLYSNNENYIVQVVTATISIKEPYMQLRKTSTDVNGGGGLIGGEELRYNLLYTNNGSDSSLNTSIIDTIPTGTTYKPGSIQIGGIAKTDAADADQAEYDAINNRVIIRVGNGATGAAGGRVLASTSGTANFSVYASPICFVQACNNIINNSASIFYTGATSGTNFNNKSGTLISGCFTETPTSDLVTGLCKSVKDTTLANICPAPSITLPFLSYVGYRFYSALPFTPANAYNPAIPVTTTRVYYAFYDGPGICNDTIQLNVFITSCPDIDDDNDGIPDYVEMNDSTAWKNNDGDGLLNWNDPTPGGGIIWVDNNNDTFNDNFDPSADSDNDGIPNFSDASFPGFIDTNSDGVNDNMDKDLDGIPNHLDLDSDNDGIPDTVESFGVDANGDGRIDNYSDTDNDGFSQNVDANMTGVTNSALGLGPLDTDGDKYPNYLDLDSDNDGIPDITEAFGTDAGNSAKVSVFTDTDGDGYADALDADVGNDNVAENSAASILKTSADGNGDGRTDTWPFKNMDSDSKPSPYDLDSDGDGITDVKEAQFTDADWNGRVDGAINANGRNTALTGLPSLTIPNTDGVGRSNPYDIDSDEDGIPDNVEGQSTISYLLPANTLLPVVPPDTDLDGINDSYDNFNGFGGDGIHPVNTDADLIPAPDYIDLDTDNDGLIDRVEGNDLNLNGLPDDNVTLTGTDTDGDGLDDRFDANNSSAEATSARMGNGGSTSGDPTPGSITTVQRTPNSWGCGFERDWRCIFYILSCDIISFKAVLQNQQVKLDWTVFCKQAADQFIVQRSIDGILFVDVANFAGNPVINEVQSYSDIDNISLVNAEILYYRLITILKNGKRSISNIISFHRKTGNETDVEVMPNPVRENFQLAITANTSTVAEILLFDGNGKKLQNQKERLQPGTNTFSYDWTRGLPAGMYYLGVNIGASHITKKLYVIK